LKVVARVIATWFFCGYAPLAPGTVGSAAALAIAWLLHRYAAVPPVAFVFLAVLLAIPGTWAADVASREADEKDPQFVVVDEVMGQWITIGGALQLNWKSWVGAFVLFRLLDVWKPAPARQLESLPGGMGIVADDAMAGLYGALVLLAAGWFNLY